MHRSIIINMIIFCLMSHPVSAEIGERAMHGKRELQESYPIPGSFILREQRQELRRFLAYHPEAINSTDLSKAVGWNFTVGSTKPWYADDITNNTRYLIQSTCRAVGSHCYIFVEDASWNTRVWQKEVDSIRIYFDQKTLSNPSKGIFQMDVDAFGIPPDVDSDPKIIILLLNIKDGYTGSGGYVVGYFQPINEMDPTQPPSQPYYPTSNFAEMFYIDTNPLDLTSKWGLEEGLSTLAHEFQHMINFNYDRQLNRLTFLDEGCSLIAEIHCGYPIFNQSEYIDEPNYYLFGWRYNDFINVFNDYARAARFFVYLRDQAGMEVFKPIVASSFPDERSIDEGLTAIGSTLRFSTILPSWFIANILNDTTVNPLYGYRYPHLPKATSITSYVPNTSGANRSVERYAVQYYSLLGGSQLKAAFLPTSGGIQVKAVEIGSDNNRVLEVPQSTEFSEPDFGTTYTQIHFVVMNLNRDNSSIYSYATSGSGGVTATTLSYSSSTRYYITLPSAYTNQKFAVRFSPITSGELYAASIALNGGNDAIQGNGDLLISAWTNNSQGSIGGTPAVQIGTSVSVPFGQLTTNWNYINMRGANVSVTQGVDFHIVVETSGGIGDTLQFLLDDGISSPTNRTSSYRYGLNGLDWYNRADPNYGSNNSPSYENLLLSATIASDVVSTLSQNTLKQNFPNPFSSTNFPYGTTISYELLTPSYVTLKVYNILGQEIATLVDGYEETGHKEVAFRSGNLSSGVYFYRIKTENFSQTKKMVIVK